MVLAHFIFALAVALVVVLVFSRAFRHPGRPHPLGLVLLVFLVTWAGGVWLTPFGPKLWDAFFFPFLMTGLVAFLLLAALGPPPGKKGSNTFRQEGRRSDSRPPPAGNVYTLSLTLILVLLILAYYIT